MSPDAIHPYRLAWSFKIGRVFGIDIKVHLVFLALLLFLFAQAWAKHSLFAGILTLFLFLLLFLFVLLHELGHSVAAQKLGIRVRDITLWPLGGLARLEEIPEIPAVELRIALAGPAVNFAIVLLTIAAARIAGGPGVLARIKEDLSTLDIGGMPGILFFILAANALMGFLNLIPAFPLDGGRILRALAARRLPYIKATALAVRIGKLLAVTGIFVLFLNHMLFSSLTLICLFIYWAGSFELRAARAREFMKAAERGFGPFPGRGQRTGPGPDILEAEVLSATTEEHEVGPGPRPGGPGAGSGSGKTGFPSREGYRDLSEEELERYRTRFEEEFLRLVEKYRKGGS